MHLLTVDGWWTTKRAPAVGRGRSILLYSPAIIVPLAQVTGRFPPAVDFAIYLRDDWRSYGAWTTSTYVYPPPLAQLLSVIPDAPWAMFAWQALSIAALMWMLRWIGLVLLPIGYLALVHEVRLGPLTDAGGAVLATAFIGNVAVLILAASLFRHPAGWAFGALTKLYGGIGVVWHAARGEWRQVALTMAIVAGVTAVSFLLDPAAWVAFARFLVAERDKPPLPVHEVPFALRAPIAVALLWWGARRDAGWTIPLALTLASPALYVGAWIVPTLVAVRLVAHDRTQDVDRAEQRRPLRRRGAACSSGSLRRSC